MKSCQLGLTLSVVGPRARLLDMPKWPMALRITVGTSDDPANAAGGAGNLVHDSLPWNLWLANLPDIVLVDQNGKHVATPVPVQPLAENADFLALLQASVEEAGRTLADAGYLSFEFASKPVEVTDKDDGPGTSRSETEKVAWPGLLMTLNTLASPTPSATKSTWYFYIDREVVAEEGPDGWKLKDGIAISAAPKSVNGAVHQLAATVFPAAAGAKYPTHTHSYDQPLVEAHCQALEVASVLNHGLDELDNYWLSIRDSRDDSLLDLVKRVEAALNPASVLGSFSAEELASACTSTKPDGQVSEALPEEVAKVMQGWRKIAMALSGRLRQDTDAVIKQALASGTLYADALRDAYRSKIVALLLEVVAAPAVAGGSAGSLELLPAAADRLGLIAEARLLPRIGSQVKAATPGEGVELLIGDESLRLRHSHWDGTNAVDDVAAIQLFGRRSSDKAGIEVEAGANGAAPWYCLTASRYALLDGLSKTVNATDRLTGVTAAYSDDILCREVSYRGANLVARNALQGAHREKMDADVGSSLMFARLQRLPSTDLRVIPLRYGDWYEFAASVIDRAGGMAPELAPVAPWAWDRLTMETLCPPQRDRVLFLRRVPVGECSLRPAVGTSWPQTPKNVWLRCLESAESRGEKQDAPTILLAPQTDAFQRIVNAKRQEVPSRYAFIVEPPRVDEHTLLRWDMPATTSTANNRLAETTTLKAAVSDILAERDARMSTVAAQAPADWNVTPANTADYLPFDPAVSGIGVRWKFDTGETGAFLLPAATQEVVVREGLANASVSGVADFTVGPGNFLRLGICALVTKDAFTRMDSEALQTVLDPVGWNDKYVAFAETVAYVESATPVLPALIAKQIKLVADGIGDIAFSYDFTGMSPAENALYDAVHQIEIKCERWKWRNLPLPAKPGVMVKAIDRARRFASGPPEELMDETLRDDPASELVSSFDKLSSIDTGFVLRPNVIKRFPRVRSGNTPIHVDSRDAHTHADYLRYSARLISRYVGVLAEPARKQWTGPRRIATGFRGDVHRIKPPQILAILPLTHMLESSPVGERLGGATQFLVILDEIWFREYGIGERIEARISTVKREIGETVNPKELRLGPLPDHSVSPIALADTVLDCFGPFGMTLDRSGSQALANATAFVLYPPQNTPPHYNLFVEFRRVLDLPSGPIDAMASDFTQAAPMYTLPDTRLLNAPDGVHVTHGAAGLSFKAPSELTPFPGAVGGVLTQYRYALIVGKMVRDGGRAVDVFLPEDVLWLVPGVGLGNDDRKQALWFPASKKNNFSAGVIVEILLNGRYPFPEKGNPDTHSLSDATDLRDLFRRMLNDADKDAPGMLRRVSSIFKVTA